MGLEEGDRLALGAAQTRRALARLVELHGATVIQTVNKICG